MTTPRRADALARAFERHPEAAARFAETHGLTLSRQVALLAAFFAGLDDEERRALQALGLAPAGPTRWYTDAGWARRVRPGLDARLDFRYRRDPPELVTVATGSADGQHFGFFHDEPDEAPWLLVENVARDTAETVAVNGRARTVVDFLRIRVKVGLRDGLPVAPLHRVLDELDGAGTEVLAAEKRAHRKRAVTRLDTLGGAGPSVPPEVARTPIPSRAARRTALTTGDPLVATWLAAARSGLAAGEPALALTLGRDLWFLDDGRGDEAVALLESGYAALGREALARIARVHHTHRGIASVDVYP